MKEPQRKSSTVTLPRFLLDEDSDIISDQDEHLVLTVRRLKKLICDNHELLMELAVRSHTPHGDVPAEAKAAALQQDLAILDDQDHHLGMTLRVSKEFIRKNIWMLTAPSESCVD
jgi:hypothetical protein